MGVRLRHTERRGRDRHVAELRHLLHRSGDRRRKRAGRSMTITVIAVTSATLGGEGLVATPPRGRVLAAARIGGTGQCTNYLGRPLDENASLIGRADVSVELT